MALIIRLKRRNIIKICHSCGTQFAGDVTFCPQCGEKQIASPKPPPVPTDPLPTKKKGGSSKKIIIALSIAAVVDIIFKEGRALFYPATLKKSSTFREMKVNFGIVPCPMWDEYQDGYYTSAVNNYSVACIPVDVKDLNMSGAVFETLSIYSHENVLPAYYEHALKYTLTLDMDSAAMLDIIRDGFKFNFGVFYSGTLDECGMQINDLMNQENVNYVSFHASHKKGYERKLNGLLKYYE